jgi:outer membrane biosynthesis protein TonB
MTIGFEKEKNIKAGLITAVICLLLFCIFFFFTWELPQIPTPSFGEGIEVNLGNSETGLGTEPPQIPGEAATETDNTKTTPPAQVEASKPIQTDANETNEAAAVATKTVKKEAVTTPPIPTPPKPKAVFGGGTSTTTSGNNADSYNGKTDQGTLGGKGDQGKPNGNPNSDSYTGNGGYGSGNGVSISRGLQGRKINRFPSFEDDFDENAKVAVDIKVDNNGNVSSATIQPRGTTTGNANMKNIAIRKARQLKFNTDEDGAIEQMGTIIFSFRIRQ